MTKLLVHGQQVETVFELLGKNENAMTYSLSWALAKGDRFRRSFAELLGIDELFSNAFEIRLQEHVSKKGYTDIELIDPGKHHIIIEAKRGFSVPGSAQLEKYAERLIARADQQAEPLIVVLAESDRDESWLLNNVPETVKGLPVKAISWKTFQNSALLARARANNEEKRMLSHLATYLDKVTRMQNQYSNQVYVVSLNANFCFGRITFIDVVEKYQKYFHPVGGGAGGWPVEPPNYIAFRYGGMLQSIHHIESYTVINNFHPYFDVPEDSQTERPYYLYTLGDAIKPLKPTPTNDPQRNSSIPMATRVWCFLDLLLTCESISEAAKKTRERSEIAVG